MNIPSILASFKESSKAIEARYPKEVFLVAEKLYRLRGSLDVLKQQCKDDFIAEVVYAAGRLTIIDLVGEICILLEIDPKQVTRCAEELTQAGIQLSKEASLDDGTLSKAEEFLKPFQKTPGA